MKFKTCLWRAFRVKLAVFSVVCAYAVPAFVIYNLPHIPN